MNEVYELYQEIIIDHSRSPKNFGLLEHKTHTAVGNNPLCGDSINVDLIINNDKIIDIKFNGQGCAIFLASASLMSEIIKEKNLDEVKKLFEYFQNMLTKDDESNLVELKKLSVLKGVREFPIRIKCATLSWHALIAAIGHNNQAITTE